MVIQLYSDTAPLPKFINQADLHPGYPHKIANKCSEETKALIHNWCILDENAYLEGDEACWAVIDIMLKVLEGFVFERGHYRDLVARRSMTEWEVLVTFSKDPIDETEQRGLYFSLLGEPTSIDWKPPRQEGLLVSVQICR